MTSSASRDLRDVLRLLRTELDLFAAARHWKSYAPAAGGPYLGREVLEVGAATARRRACSVRPGARWVCLEPDACAGGPGHAAIARGRAARLLSRRDRHAGTDLTKGTFDTILYMDVLEHIADDRGRAGAGRSQLARRASVLSSRRRTSGSSRRSTKRSATSPLHKAHAARRVTAGLSFARPAGVSRLGRDAGLAGQPPVAQERHAEPRADRRMGSADGPCFAARRPMLRHTAREVGAGGVVAGELTGRRTGDGGSSDCSAIQSGFWRSRDSPPPPLRRFQRVVWPPDDPCVVFSPLQRGGQGGWRRRHQAGAADANPPRAPPA